MSTTTTEKKTLEQAHAERDEAMVRAEQGMDPTWGQHAAQAVRDLATLEAVDGDPFTADDVWELLADRGVPAPREPRALGPVLKALADGPDAVVKSVGFAPSRRRHGAPVTAYRAR